MDHTIAIAVLTDELDLAKENAEYLASGIATMMMSKLASKRIREDSLLRWRKKLDRQQDRIHSLRTTIKFLEHHSLGGKK